jgi:tetratricopeptide (TPR) repeat protein
MFRVNSVARMSDRQLDRSIKRLGVLFLVLLVAFIAFYVVDRYRDPGPTMIDRNIIELEEAVRTDPADVVARGRLADMYVAATRYDEAIVQYDAILETGKETELAHFGRAKAYMGTGALDAAAADYEAVVEIAKDGEMAHVDPLLNAAYFGLGSIALEQGRPDDAVEQLTLAVNIRRSDADSLNLLGLALVQTGEPEQAVEILQRAVAFVPLGWVEPYETMALAYTDLGQQARAEWAGAMADLSANRPEEARTRLLAITEGDAALDAAIGLALVAETQGDFPAAVEWYTKALAIDPENAAARLGLTRVGDPAASAPAASGAPLPALPDPADDRRHPGSRARGAGRDQPRRRAEAAAATRDHPLPAPGDDRPAAAPAAVVPAFPPAAPDHPADPDRAAARLCDQRLRRHQPDRRRGDPGRRPCLRDRDRG